MFHNLRIGTICNNQAICVYLSENFCIIMHNFGKIKAGHSPALSIYIILSKTDHFEYQPVDIEFHQEFCDRRLFDGFRDRRDSRDERYLYDEQYRRYEKQSFDKSERCAEYLIYDAKEGLSYYVL